MQVVWDADRAAKGDAEIAMEVLDDDFLVAHQFARERLGHLACRLWEMCSKCGRWRFGVDESGDKGGGGLYRIAGRQ